MERPQAERARQVPGLLTRARHPKRARAYLLTDQAVTATAAEHAGMCPELDDLSRRAMLIGTDEPDSAEETDSGDSPNPANALWVALCAAPDEGWDIGDLMWFTGMTRPTLDQHLRAHVTEGRAYQVSQGRWRARSTEEPSP